MGSSSHPPAGNSGQKRSVYIDGNLHIFVNKCRSCGDAFSINVKDLTTGGHRTTIVCPFCGVKEDFHTD